MNIFEYFLLAIGITGILLGTTLIVGFVVGFVARFAHRAFVVGYNFAKTHSM